MSSFPIPHSTLHTGTSPRVAIIGGGISGLAAAHRLLELVPQAQLTLFEASNRLGGVLDTVECDNFLIERSADNFLASPAAAVELCQRLGIEHELLPTDESRRRAFVVRNARLAPIPEGFYLMSPRKLWPILRSPILSVRGKLRLLAEPFVQRGPAASNPNIDSDESVASFASRRLGREVFERIVQPLVGGIYTADPEKLSMAATMPKFLEYERTHGSLLRATRSRAQEPADQTSDATAATGARYNLFLAPKRGIQALIRALADRLPANAIRLNSAVTNVTNHNDQWDVTTSPNPQSEIRNPQSPFDALIVAVPTYAAASLLNSVDQVLAAELAAIEYAGCAVVSLGFHRRQIGHPLNGFGFVVPRIEHRRIIAASFASLKFPQRAPDDDVLIRVFIGGALQPELLALPDDELRRIATEDLATLLGAHGEPLVCDIARWPRSMPQYHVGHVARVARIEELAARHPTLALAGNAYHGVGIPQCIASGESAAERIAAHLRTATRQE